MNDDASSDFAPRAASVRHVKQLLAKQRYFHASIGDLSNYAELRHVVLSDPKTGSTSLAHALQEGVDGQFKLRNVMHMHTDGCIHRLFDDLAAESLSLRDLLRARASVTDEPINVFTVLRDPVTRFMSHFFHNVVRRLPEPIDVAQAGALLESSFAPSEHVHWQFDRCFGVDILQAPFRRDGDVYHLKTGLARIFVVSIDKLAQSGPVLSDLLGHPVDLTKRVNETRKGWVGDLYKEFMQRYRPRRAEIDALYWADESYARRFVLEDASEEWRDKAVDTAPFDKSTFQRFARVEYVLPPYRNFQHHARFSFVRSRTFGAHRKHPARVLAPR